ncbi:MAG TPA: 16S rRNA (adenine(1518)-N(6)/adenine(1519)-N(6))-dimethyltransferase RsmA [Puia sp.]|nr:16S rRNA (adenine(1518)-N(6)/adenine(1519)-N(6))-dimethyltransferase RsmA [Puia sp.]
MYTLKKSLGQHFLHDENVCRKIVTELKRHSFTRLLEVGPGSGALTKYLLELPGVDFKAVEIDNDKVSFLEKTFPGLTGKLIESDFLRISKPFPGNFTIVGNFPYNISSQIVFRILDWRDSVECMIGMFQKEVAQRICAEPGGKVYGIISVLTQAFYEPTYLFEVSEKSFTPPPKVRSAVIRLLPRQKAIVNPAQEQNFRLLVRTAFNQRRKTMRNAVKQLFDEEILRDDLFEKRAEQLSVFEFSELSLSMKNQKYA